MKPSGFTLAELLISLAILGAIATFTIPKVLQAQQNQSYNVKAKEAAAMVSGAFQQYTLNTQLTSSFGIQNLTPFMNYVAVDTTSTVDWIQTGGTLSCSSNNCLKLHNGAILIYNAADSFSGTNTTNAIWFEIDPDGVNSGTTNGPGKSVEFWLQTNGKLTTYCQIGATLTYSGGTRTATPAYDPPWFSW